MDETGSGTGKPELNEMQFFSEKPIEAAKRIIEESAPFAAQSIATMATDDTIAASVRLRAAQYIVDRNLGPVGQGGDEQGRLEAFLEELSTEANRGH
jgi:hypothetical protein